MDLHNFSFALQDLTDRINSRFLRITFQRNLLLIGFYSTLLYSGVTLRHKIFPMKISSLHCNGAAYTCNEKLCWKGAGEYQMSQFPFF